ncbi:IclR family transcriptional regulator [Oricola sp.]|uniref:IclR family transcriptional regulator n=1 Tax=Oricola sp. TaxID=1979950 RepID=UPI0025EC9820|nr:IclR family transcriptional regulator [Oricola sp.]MCI5077877.1 IclR family transcriptional regulator [Oricola sp.]
MNARNSLERILALLDVFTEHRLEWTPDELMEALGYSRPTLYRYLKILKEAGFVTSMPSGGFALGPRVVELDYLMRKSDTLTQYARPQMEAFAAAYPCAAMLVRWYGNKLLVVASETTTPELENDYPRGRPLPLARGAISRAIMSALNRRKLVPIIEANLTELSATGLGDTIDEIVSELRRIRRRGYAVAVGELTPGVTGIAAPIFDGGATPIGTFCVTIADTAATPELVERIGGHVREVCSEISARLGADRRASEAG